MACPPAVDVRGRNRMMEFSGFKNTGRDILTIADMPWHVPTKRAM